MLTTPAAERLRWLLTFHRGAVRSPHLVRFLNALRRHRRKRIILLWDRLPAHKSRRVTQAIRRHRDWLRIEWLPPYAPELNPIELLWDWLDDTALANVPIEAHGQLRGRVRTALRCLRRQPAIGRGFLRHTGLF